MYGTIALIFKYVIFFGQNDPPILLFSPVHLFYLRKFPIFTFIQAYISISFSENFPSIPLFAAIVYSEL